MVGCALVGQFGIGQSIKRFEDVRLLRGEGRFHADVNLPNQVHAVLVRSPHAHARIRAIDADAARRAPGVLAVFTGADVVRDGLGRRWSVIGPFETADLNVRGGIARPGFSRSRLNSTTTRSALSSCRLYS